MPVRSVKNQYLGINAHLHSLWQAEGGWNNFHNRHIGDLAGLLRQKLLPMGYTATIEESLQIRRLADSLHNDEDAEAPYRAIAISERGVNEPVAWIELMSSSNKGTGNDAQTYGIKRKRLVN